MVRRAVLGTLCLLLLVACGSSGDDEPDISVSNAWSRPVSVADEMESGHSEGDEQAGVNGVVYLTIENRGGAPDVLGGATSSVAETAELHETTSNEGVMEMRPVTTIEIPSNDTVVFSPGGYHIMLVNLQQDLKIGDTFDVELEFESSGKMTVTVEVRDE